ncbi:hydrogenase small subunit [Thioalkalivibrio sp. ALJT]|uniref:hydrogenase small subunit n=1 Tax=Thioalkalivibrio sp. ALJT TaxID=1158146 RepID=UPI0003A61C10|nr:hydrogenase small subunit [Thioalkalivibrio sp. ALJT]
MKEQELTLGEELRRQGISRRSFLKFCAAVASSMAIPASMVPAMAESLAKARRQSVIWMSYQECTGCIESLTRSYTPTLESMLFNFISLDYQHALQAAAGRQAEDALHQAMEDNWGEYLVIADGSIPLKDDGVYSTVDGHTNLESIKEVAEGAAAIIAIGTCAAYGGVGAAKPNPTGAVGVDQIITDKPILNVPGCPPMPEVMTGVLTSYLAFGRLPDVDSKKRPLAFFGDTIHDRCYRRPYYDLGLYAKSFDDEGARKGWCLYELGCKGPITYNACATTKWNQGTSWPVQSGHGCIGCSEPNFWDKDSFYKPLSAGQWGSAEGIAIAAAAGVAAGAAAAVVSRKHQDNLAGGNKS